MRTRFAHLPEPSFIERDGSKILAEMVADFEARTGRPLQPTQAERILIDMWAYRETLVRVAIQQACLQQLVAYAAFPMVDHLGALANAPRLAAAAARTSVRWTLPGPAVVPSVIPSGTRVRTKDGKVTFTTDADATIVAGALTVDVGATASPAGLAGNDYAPGQVSEIIDPPGFSVTATNVGTTEGGSPSEDSDSYAERIPDAIRGLSVAGPEDAYRYVAKSAHPDIIDVSVTTPTPGTVRLAVLTRAGAASPTILALVLAAASAKTVRPICDTVTAQSAAPVAYAISAQVTLRQGTPSTVVADAAARATAYAAEIGKRLGRPPIRSQIIAAMMLPGVHRVELTSPASDVAVSELEWASCAGVTATLAGYWSGP